MNTGWTGGPYGTGERMNINHTRTMVRAALNGELDGVATRHRPDLRRRGADRAARTSRPSSSQPRVDLGRRRRLRPPRPAKLARMFAENFTAYADGVPTSVRAAGPRVVDDAAPESAELAGPGEG